jgi:origin recognition complex subunit 3
VIKDNNEGSLWRLPDTSILFRRYLDSGRMVNVYDWFESFQAVLETQKEELKKQSARGRKRKASAKGKEKGTKKRASVSSKKQSGKGKGKQRQLDDDEAGEDEMDADGEEGEGEDAEEKWKLEVQARFMRALHELDYLAFIKHTKRRADHVVRTVFEVNE